MKKQKIDMHWSEKLSILVGLCCIAVYLLGLYYCNIMFNILGE